MREPAHSRLSTDRIGVLAALFQGFDRVAARPILILPPLLLDLFLWLGPRLRITSLMEAVQGRFSELVMNASPEPALGEQISILREGLALLGERFNLLVFLSTLPVGIPSLMKSRLPAASPIGTPISVQVSDLSTVAWLWLLLTIAGLGAGAIYHLSLARQTAPQSELARPVQTWARTLLLAVVAYLILGFVLVLVSMLASLVALLNAVLGMVVIMVGLSLLFWIVVYLFFTPHGIVRYRFTVLQAMKESALLVRWNMVSTLGFLGLVLLLSWLTGEVWMLPQERSWYLLLAMVGHAFVVSTILAGSYAFYQGRREWLVSFQRALAERLESGQPGEPEA